MKYTSASAPKYGDKMPHLRCSKDDIGDIVLLPGDPGRVHMFKDLCEDFKIVSTNREYTVGTGTYKGVKITVCSTGIGAPSTEIAVMELIGLGAKALLRIGGTAAIREDVNCSEIIINTGAMRLGGSSVFYARPEYPAIASFEVVESFKNACEERNSVYHMGICASIGSFYHGQGRGTPFEKNYDEMAALKQYTDLNILNLEMEAETIFTLSSLYGVYTGSICSVHCNRITDKWLIDYEESQINMCKIALEGAVKLKNKYMNI